MAQFAGMMLDGPTVVVSPLIALQRDQVDALEEGEAVLGDLPYRGTPANLDAAAHWRKAGPTKD